MAKYSTLLKEVKGKGLKYWYKNKDTGKTVFLKKEALLELLSDKLLVSKKSEITTIDKEHIKRYFLRSTPNTLLVKEKKGDKTLSIEQALNDTVSRLIGVQIDTLREEFSKKEGVTTTISIVLPTDTVVLKDEITHTSFKHVLELASQRQPIYLVGPTGSGKTVLAEQVARSLKLDFSCISCSIGMSESSLLGKLLPKDGGAFGFTTVPFINAYENGGLFLLDEIDSADANLMIVINSALSNNILAIPNRMNNPIAKKHKDFVLIAAANTYGNGADCMFVGRNQLDAATLDRFLLGTVYMDYDPKIEESVTLPEILDWGLEVRAKIKKHKLRRVLSTRFMEKSSIMFKAYSEWSLKEVKDIYFQSWSNDEKQKLGDSV